MDVEATSKRKDDVVATLFRRLFSDGNSKIQIKIHPFKYPSLYFAFTLGTPNSSRTNSSTFRQSYRQVRLTSDVSMT